MHLSEDFVFTEPTHWQSTEVRYSSLGAKVLAELLRHVLDHSLENIEAEKCLLTIALIKEKYLPSSCAQLW